MRRRRTGSPFRAASLDPPRLRGGGPCVFAWWRGGWVPAPLHRVKNAVPLPVKTGRIKPSPSTARTPPHRHCRPTVPPPPSDLAVHHPAERRCQRHGAAGFEHQLELGERKRHRGEHLRLAHRDAARAVRAEDAEGQRAGDQRLQRIAQRRAGIVDRQDRPGGKAARDVVIAMRLDRHHRQPRPQRDAARQPAAAAAHQREVGTDAHRSEVCGDLQPRGPLPRDDVGIVEAGDDRRAALGRQPCRDGRAVPGVAVVEYHLGTEPARPRDLHRGRVRRHDDDRRHAEQLRRERHALRMVAARERDHAGGAFACGHRRQPVVRAAELERAGTLQILGLEPQPRAADRVERVRAEQRRTHRDPRDTRRRDPDIGFRNHSENVPFRAALSR